MNEEKTERGNAGWIVLYIIYSAVMVALLCLLFLLPGGRVRWLIHAGWALFALSALLGWLPILVFRRHGRVSKGKSYIHTTQLVTSGIYAVVRHPQYFASDLLAAAVMCITQHWSTLALGLIGIASNHITMRRADRDLVRKFGAPYQEYMERVPQWNLVIGLWRWSRRRSDPRRR